jgi:hypothetical protein
LHRAQACQPPERAVRRFLPLEFEFVHRLGAVSQRGPCQRQNVRARVSGDNFRACSRVPSAARYSPL